MSMIKAVNWLLEGPPWVQYRTRIDLLGQDENEPEVIAAKRAMLTSPAIKALISELGEWPGSPLKRHNDASQLLHKLVFISDLGIRIGDPGIDRITERIIGTQSKEGAFQVIANISPRYGGSGQDQLVWMLCDAPSTIYSMLKLGVKENAIRSASLHLASLSFDNGWPCAVSSVLGKFRGPGRKTDPCPYATLIGALKRPILPWKSVLMTIGSSQHPRRPCSGAAIACLLASAMISKFL